MTAKSTARTAAFRQEYFTTIDVKGMLGGVTDKFIDSLIAAGVLPRPAKPSGKTRLWSAAQIDQFRENVARLADEANKAAPAAVDALA